MEVANPEEIDLGEDDVPDDEEGSERAPNIHAALAAVMQQQQQQGVGMGPGAGLQCWRGRAACLCQVARALLKYGVHFWQNNG